MQNTNYNLTNTPICHVHNFIQDECTEILSAIQESPIKDTIKQEIIEQRIARILYMCGVAEEQGQRMENRLREYKEKIESMGFIRAKKVKDPYNSDKNKENEDENICPLCGYKLHPIPYSMSIEIDGSIETVEFIDYFCDIHGTKGRDF